MSEDSSPLSTVDKAIDVLFHLHAAQEPCGVTALARALDAPKSSVHRLLSALVRRGLVEREAGGRYRPGVGLMALGLGVLEREPVVVAARPVLEAAADAIGETFFLVGARAGALIVLEKAEGTGFLRAAPRVGGSVPVHATAVGKLYLALDPGQIAEDPVDAWQVFTEQTLIDGDALRAEVEAVRASELASNRDEWIAGLTVLAAPIRIGERLVGAVALAASSPRVSELGEQILGDRVRRAAAEITARLSGTA
jgi:IclR family acetate operon transcriptional repressor